ncbi:ash family protein [Escherichia coli]|nr:ash family protein [Escherichia coli]QWV68062.1 ash family protein [Escherichia coli O158:H23]EEU3019605.1 ash family protein [Escherichia coli]EEX5382732.1 ash family protein [Escherichia coli]EFA7268620.1 ash family protein [Escherichia coli]
MAIQKNRLPAFVWSGYISRAPHKTGAGFRSLQKNRAHNRASGFFMRAVSSHLFRTRIMAGRTGPTSVGPDPLFSGTANLVRLATHSFAALDGELYLSLNRGYPLWQTVNNSAPALSVVTSRPKSTADCTGLSLSPESCTSICCVIRDARLHLITLPPRSVTWQTICGICNAWLTIRRITCNALFPEIMKRHSAIWRGVWLPVIREDI